MPLPRVSLKTEAPATDIDGSSSDDEWGDGRQTLDDSLASRKPDAYVCQGRLSHALYHSLLNVVTAAIPTIHEIRYMQAKRGEAIDVELAETCPVCLQPIQCFYRHMWWECDLARDARHQAALSGQLLPPGRQPRDPLFA